MSTADSTDFEPEAVQRSRLAVVAGVVIRLLLVAAVTIAALLLGLGFTHHGEGGGAIAGTAKVTYYCSMHPQIQSDQPGLCPICNMALVIMPDASDIPATVPPRSELAAKLDGLETVRVQRRVLRHELDLVGKVEVDETRLSKVTAWTAGRLDTLYVNYTGIPVRKGEHMVSLYSPELLTAQTQLLQDKRALEALGEGASQRVRSSTERSLESSRENLRLLGLTEAQITRLEEGGRRLTNLEIVSPAQGIVFAMHRRAGDWVQRGTPIYDVADLSRVWIYLDVPEAELGWIHLGQSLEVVPEAYGGRSFSAVVTFIHPEVEPRTSSVRIRLEADNKSGLLKPGMFVRAHGPSLALTSGGDSLVLVVPRTAVLDTGIRHLAFVVREAHEGPGTEARGRVVQLGAASADEVQIVAGLEEGEMLVRHANFRIDSAVALEARSQLSSRDLRSKLEEVYSAYFALVRALAGDDVEGGRAALAEVSAALEALGDAPVPEAGRELWQELGTPLTAFVPETGDDASVKQSLFRLTALMAPVLEQFGREDAPVWLMECPMAGRFRAGDLPALQRLPMPSPEGAHWFQDHPHLKNPYFGSMMLECGTTLGRLPAYILSEPEEKPGMDTMNMPMQPSMPGHEGHGSHQHGEER